MFIKQTRPYNCGYVAAVNLMKLIGYSANKYTLLEIEKDFGLDRDGVSKETVQDVLNQYGVNNQSTEFIGVKKLLNVLEQRPIILGFTYFINKELDGHFIVVFKKNGRLYSLNNNSFKNLSKIDSYKDLHHFKTIYPISKVQLANYLKINNGIKPDIIMPKGEYV